MHPVILAELRVERHRQHPTLASGHRMAVEHGENLDIRAVLGDPRRPYEHPPERAALQPPQIDVRLEALDLASERVACRR